MYYLKDLLDTIPTNDNEDRKCTYLDCLSATDFQSENTMRNFLATWVDMPDPEVQNLSQADRDYRQFLLEFWEIYNDHRQV